MKKNHLSAILLALIVILPVFAGQDNPPQDVPIASNPDKGGIFRAPALVPISCLYSDGVLTFTFSADLGTVECEVIRQSDLEVYDATFQAVDGGSDSLYVSTDAGDYEITLTLSNGTAFYGEYTLE